MIITTDSDTTCALLLPPAIATLAAQPKNEFTEEIPVSPTWIPALAPIECESSANQSSAIKWELRSYSVMRKQMASEAA